MKQILSAVLLISIIFFSCKKESYFNGNQSPNEAAGARSQGKGKPRPPVANAGPDQTIIPPTNTATLNGSGSTDPNNDISSYLWTKVSGPPSGTIVNPGSRVTQVTNLVDGVYQFELTVADARGMIDKDVVRVTVLANSPPPCTTCKIVFVSARDGNNEIYTCNTDGSNITRLTNDPGDDSQPEWSPDGTRIAFTSTRDGNYEIYIMNADGSNVVQRTFSGYPDQIQGLTWSPDGTKIAYSAYTDGYGNAINAVDATSGTPIFLFGLTNNDVHPAWSPDGTKIAVSGYSHSDHFYDYQGIYTINPDGTGFTMLFWNTNFDFYYPSWSPNGAKLAVWFNGQVGVLNFDGSGFNLLPPSAAVSGISWSGDGTAIVYTSSSGNVSWVAADGSAGGTIVTNGWDADWQH